MREITEEELALPVEELARKLLGMFVENDAYSGTVCGYKRKGKRTFDGDEYLIVSNPDGWQHTLEQDLLLISEPSEGFWYILADKQLAIKDNG